MKSHNRIDRETYNVESLLLGTLAAKISRTMLVAHALPEIISILTLVSYRKHTNTPGSE